MHRITAALLLACALAPPARAQSPLCPPAERAILAEVFYDAVGDDSGHEFVELYNPTEHDWPLAGARLDAGDGSAPGRWSLRWTGGPGHTIAAGGRFVIGGARVVGVHALAVLDLQNGPDAIRLVWPDGLVETLGYGNHEFSEYACGAPAADVPSGSSLARVPDRARSGDNAADFRPSAPSPGFPNQVSRDVAIVHGTLALDPDQPDPMGAVRARLSISASGAQPLAAGSVVVAAWLDDHALGTLTIDKGLAPAETVAVELAGNAAAAGKQMLRVQAIVAGDQQPGNDADSLRVRVGDGPLEVTEIQFHPGAGEGEWVEIRNRAAESLSIAAFRFSDRGQAAGAVRDSSARLAPDSLGVIAQDRRALVAAHPGIDTTRVWEVRPWPALNNSDGADGIADIVVIREDDGTPCSRSPYGARDVPAGVPIERGPAGVWRPALDRRGTPLEPPREPAPLASMFVLTPARAPPGGAVQLEWSLPWPSATVDIDVYDLAGVRVARAAVGIASAGRGAMSWTAPGVPPGVYVLALLARSPEGGAVSAARALRLGGAAR